MLISVAVCPHPPVLVPEVAGEAAHELDGLRTACDEAVGRLREPAAQAPPDALIVVGGGAETRAYDQGTATLHPYGLDLAWGSGPDLPLSLTIGHWLLSRSALAAGARYQSVAFDADPQECRRLGRELGASAARVALLVMGDGSACLTEKAPGFLDERAARQDAAVAEAFGQADTAALARLDPAVCTELQVAGRAAWQVLAGAADGARWRAGVLAREAPYGVGYLVASWSLRPGRAQGVG